MTNRISYEDSRTKTSRLNQFDFLNATPQSTNLPIWNFTEIKVLLRSNLHVILFNFQSLLSRGREIEILCPVLFLPSFLFEGRSEIDSIDRLRVQTHHTLRVSSNESNVD